MLRLLFLFFLLWPALPIGHSGSIVARKKLTRDDSGIVPYYVLDLVGRFLPCPLAKGYHDGVHLSMRYLISRCTGRLGPVSTKIENNLAITVSKPSS
ncbi:hypothetical protein BDW67DRAFT_151869 [Aspergillus spinulosporus]